MATMTYGKKVATDLIVAGRPEYLWRRPCRRPRSYAEGEALSVTCVERARRYGAPT